MEIKLTTLPISVNRMYRGRRFLTKEGKEIKDALVLEAWSQMVGSKPFEEEVEVNIIWFAKDNRTDIDNILKGLLDSLTGILWKDDRQIIKLTIMKEMDKKNPRIVLSCRPVKPLF